jgi:hypothetical protein
VLTLKDLLMKKPRALFHVLVLSLLVVTTAVSAAAQSNKGSIVGTVRDLNEALVPQAKIKVTSVNTGEVRETETNDEGTFIVTNLEPGAYNVTVEAPGFQPVTFQALQVETNARLPLDVKFSELSARTSSVTVTADRSTDSATQLYAAGPTLAGCDSPESRLAGWRR